MAKGYYLTEADLLVLRDMLASWRARQGRTTGRSYYPPEESSAPEVYVARVPHAGIAALDELGTSTSLDPGTGTGTDVTGNDVARSVACPIYQVIDGEFISAGFTQVVYNLSTQEVEGNVWALVLRDKFGKWFIVNDHESSSVVAIARTPASGIPALVLHRS